MEQKKLIALFGPSGCGKDTIKKNILNNNLNWNNIIPCTTRPKRANEKDGVNYYFLTNEEFTSSVLNGEMLEAAESNNWFYGTEEKRIKNNIINIGIFNIEGLTILLSVPSLKILPVYIHTDDKTRLIRALSREEVPNCTEICRRFLADKKDFSQCDFPEETFLFNNNTDSHKYSNYLGEEIVEYAKIFFDGQK